MATTTTTKTVSIELTAEQAQLVHALLWDGLTTFRDHQGFWLDQHEALADKAPVMAGEAWQTFKAWEKKETTACQAIDAITSTGVELGFSSFGIAKR